MPGRFVLSMFAGLVWASLAYGQASIEQMTPGVLVNAKERIPACRGLYELAQRGPASNEMSCVQFFIRRGQAAEGARDFTTASSGASWRCSMRGIGPSTRPNA
jgi:hypothetical protein